MAELKIKTGVKPRSLVIAAAVVNAANEMKLDKYMLITSGNDGKHGIDSKHYSDEALDFRTKHLDNFQLELLIKTVKRHLGKGYQLIVEERTKENEHLHIEYDPV